MNRVTSGQGENSPRQNTPRYVRLQSEKSSSVRLPWNICLPLRWESSKTSCVQHLQLSVPIPSSGVRVHLVEIWGLSEVKLRFRKLPTVEKSLTKNNKKNSQLLHQ